MSGGGGGVIIIRKVMVQALTDPLVHGNLPAETASNIDPILQKDVSDWTAEDHTAVTDAFNWASTHC